METVKMNEIFEVDCLAGLKTLASNSIQCCITSPPYWKQRDYGVIGQYGLESTISEYISKLLDVFKEVSRVLKQDGTLWLNLGDIYWGSGKAGKNAEYQSRHTEFGKLSQHSQRFGQPTTGKHEILKPKDLIGLPWRVAFALQQDGWYLRQDIIWHKPNPMPESVSDRCTKSHEYIFLFSKSRRYFFDSTSIAEKSAWQEERPPGVARNRIHQYKSKTNKYPNAYNIQQAKSKVYGASAKGRKGNLHFRNKRSVWTVPTKPFKEAHFAVFPEQLVVDCIKAGSRKGDIVLDPFMGSGTTALVAKKLQRKYIGFELNPKFVAIAKKRLNKLELFDS